MAPNPEQLKKTQEISRGDILFAMARPPQGDRRVFVGSSDAQIHVTDLAEEKPQWRTFEPGHRGYVMGLVWTAAGQLVSGAYDGRLIWWDPEQGTVTRQQDAHAKWIRGVVATADGKRVLSVADDMVCRVWDAESGALQLELQGHAPTTPQNFPSMLYCVAVSPDGRLAATGDRLGRAIVWDLESGEKRAEVEAPILYTWDGKQRIHSIGGARSLAFSPDSKLLALGGIGTIGNIDHLGALARVEIFDWEQGAQTHEFKGDTHKGLVEHMQFDPQGKWLCALGGDHGGFIQFLDLEKTTVLKQDKAPMHIHEAAFNEACDEFCAVGHGKLAVWSLQGE
jgi:WD40 repeat protein